MQSLTFHSDATFMVGSALFGSKASKDEEIDMMQQQNAYLTEQIIELKELNGMYQADLESGQTELSNTHEVVNHLNNELVASEIKTLALHISMCEKDIEICRLRIAIFKLQNKCPPNQN